MPGCNLARLTSGACPPLGSLCLPGVVHALLGQPCKHTSAHSTAVNAADMLSMQGSSTSCCSNCQALKAAGTAMFSSGVLRPIVDVCHSQAGHQRVQVT